MGTCFYFYRFLKNFMDPFNASTDLFLDKLSEKADGKTPVRMVDHLSRCTLDVIAKVDKLEM